MGILRKLFKGNTLYYPGCLSKVAAKEVMENYKKILTSIGIDFIELGELEACCGSPVLNAGHREEAVELAEKNYKLFKEHGISRIITACPACYKTFSQDYPKLLRHWDIEVEHATKTIARALKQGTLKPVKLVQSLTYHDPCHLGRHCGIYEEPREALKATGAQLKEMRLTKEMAFCCGAGSGVKSNFPKLSNAAAQERIGMAEETKAECLVTTCPMCYANLKENSKRLKVMEFGELFVEEGRKK